MEVMRGNHSFSPTTSKVGTFRDSSNSVNGGYHWSQSMMQSSTRGGISQLAEQQSGKVRGIEGSDGVQGVVGGDSPVSDKEMNQIQQEVERKIANAYRRESDRLDGMSSHEFMDEFKQYGLNVELSEAWIKKGIISEEMRQRSVNIFANDSAFGTESFVKNEVLRVAGYVNSRAGIYGAWDSLTGVFGLASGYLGETPYDISYSCSLYSCNHKVDLK